MGRGDNSQLPVQRGHSLLYGPRRAESSLASENPDIRALKHVDRIEERIAKGDLTPALALLQTHANTYNEAPLVRRVANALADRLLADLQGKTAESEAAASEREALRPAFIAELEKKLRDPDLTEEGLSKVALSPRGLEPALKSPAAAGPLAWDYIELLKKQLEAGQGDELLELVFRQRATLASQAAAAKEGTRCPLIDLVNALASQAAGAALAESDELVADLEHWSPGASALRKRTRELSAEIKDKVAPMLAGQLVRLLGAAERPLPFIALEKTAKSLGDRIVARHAAAAIARWDPQTPAEWVPASDHEHIERMRRTIASGRAELGVFGEPSVSLETLEKALAAWRKAYRQGKSRAQRKEAIGREISHGLRADLSRAGELVA